MNIINSLTTILTIFISITFAINEDSPPNLVIIMTDQQNLRTLGCYRDTMKSEQAFAWGEDVKVDTPNIDVLAKEGALFTNWYTASPSCTPSRATFLCGLYPGATGATRNNVALNDDAVTFSQILQDKHDYLTSFMGKWHLDGAGMGIIPNSREFGFKNNKYRYNRGTYKFMEELNNNYVKLYNWEDKNKLQGTVEEHYITNFLFDRGIDFIRKATKKEKPFSIMISTPDPHGPYDIYSPYDQMYENMTFGVPTTAVNAFKRTPAVPIYTGQILRFNISEADDEIAKMIADEKRQNDRRAYFGMVKNIDDNVGKLLSFLRDSNLDNNTIVVFTSDHGDMLDEHGLNAKGQPYYSSGAIPFIIRYPNNIVGEKIIKTAYSTIDFFPTILNLMNATDSETLEYTKTLPGLDASKVLRNGEQLVNMKDITRYMASAKAKWATAFTSRYKLVLPHKAQTPWLFDNKKDPDELYNHADDPSYQSVYRDLWDKLYTTMFEYDFPFLYSEKGAALSVAVCVDERNSLIGDPTETCQDISTSDCELSIISTQCPVRCESCCEDSSGLLVLGGNITTCEDIIPSEHCGIHAVEHFCRESCECYSTMKPSSVMPTAEPTPEPTIEPTVEPTMKTSNEPSMKPGIDFCTEDSSTLFVKKLVFDKKTGAFKKAKKSNCGKLSKLNRKKREKICAKNLDYNGIGPPSTACPISCQQCIPS